MDTAEIFIGSKRRYLRTWCPKKNHYVWERRLGKGVTGDSFGFGRIGIRLEGMFRFFRLCKTLLHFICTNVPSPVAANNGARVSSVSWYDWAREAFGSEVERRIAEKQEKKSVVSGEWVQENLKGDNFLESEWWGIWKQGHVCRHAGEERASDLVLAWVEWVPWMCALYRALSSLHFFPIPSIIYSCPRLQVVSLWVWQVWEQCPGQRGGSREMIVSGSALWFALCISLLLGGACAVWSLWRWGVPGRPGSAQEPGCAADAFVCLLFQGTHLREQQSLQVLEQTVQSRHSVASLAAGGGFPCRSRDSGLRRRPCVPASVAVFARSSTMLCWLQIGAWRGKANHGTTCKEEISAAFTFILVLLRASAASIPIHWESCGPNPFLQKLWLMLFIVVLLLQALVSYCYAANVTEAAAACGSCVCFWL